MQDLKISLIQADLFWEQPAANMAMFEEKIWSEVDDADVIVLPEMFTTGFSMDVNKLAEVPHTNTYKWMYQIAKQKSALVIGSYIVKQGGNNYNRAYAIFPDGRSEYYDKRHLFTLADEDQYYNAGEDRLIVEWKGWKICPLVCYDLRFPVWSRNKLSKENATCDYDLLIYVANWPKPRVAAWNTLLKARAIENQSFVAGLNRIGVDDLGHQYSGNSGVYDFLGDSIAFGEDQETTISATLSKKELDEFRNRYAFLSDADEFEIR
ncbi:MAG: omega-amidase [Cyclobacteriaceae bacterium]|jgi:predicted amidohydrolase